MNAKTIIDFYNLGNSQKKVCKEFKITSNELKNILKDNNIHIRTRQEQLILENIKRTKNVNHFYFNELNNTNCYYLGFLAADATVRKDRNEIKIGLSSVDKDFLEEFRKNLDIEKEVCLRTSTKGFECAELSFSSAKIKQDIMKYGIVPNKTYIGLQLNKIPKEYQLSFIKGFFDGDGSFVYNNSTKQCTVSFACHTKSFLEDINNYFNNKGKIYKDKRSETYSLEFSTLPSLDIMKIFYEIPTPYLKRKKQKYLECLELRNKSPRDRNSSQEEEKIC